MSVLLLYKKEQNFQKNKEIITAQKEDVTTIITVQRLENFYSKTSNKG